MERDIAAVFNSTADNDNQTVATVTAENITLTTAATTTAKVGRPPMATLMQLLSGIVIILLNSATMAAFLGAKEMRRKGNILVASLAVTDIMVGVSLCTESTSWHPELFHLYRKDKWGCLARSTWLHISVISSMVHIMAIAADRYLYIVHPFLHLRLFTVKAYAALIASLWVVAVVIGTIPIFVQQFDRNGVCDLAAFQPREYLAIFGPIFYYFCLLGSLVFYLLIAKLAWTKLHVVVPVVPMVPSGDAESSINLARKLRAMRQSIVVFIAFSFFMSPHFIGYIINDFTPIPHSTRVILSLPAYINSGVNFFVYIALSKEFRATITKWLCKICCLCKRKGDNDITAASSGP